MTVFNIHLYREMRLVYEGIEAASAEEAAAKARTFRTEDAVEIADCEGETLAALVDVVGDEEYENSQMIDFESQRMRQAAPETLKALREARRLILDMGRIIRGLDDNHEWLVFWTQDGDYLCCDSRFDAIDTALAAATATKPTQLIPSTP